METTPTTISASRVPAVLGYDKRCSRLTLYLRMRGVLGEQDLSGNEAVLEGRFYEKATAEIACHKYGMKIVPGFEQMEMRSGNLSGHPDFVVVDEHGKLAICEVKNPFWSYAGDDGDDDWGEPGTDQVPRAHLLQAMVYCELLASGIEGEMMLNEGMATAIREHGMADYAYVVARLRGGVERYKVNYDSDIIRKIRSEVDLFLDRVRMDDPPSPEDEADMRIAYMADNDKVAECNLSMVSTLASIRKLGDDIRKMQKEQSELKTRVLGQMQEAGVLEYVDHHTGQRVPIATAKADRSFDKHACWATHQSLLIEKGYITVDTTKLRTEQKALYEQFMRKPENVAEQKRTIRIKSKALDQLLASTQGIES